VFLVVFGGKAVFLKPLTEIDRQTAVLKERLDKLQQDWRAFFTAEDFLKQTGKRSLGAKPDQTASRTGEMLAEAINKTGLAQTEFSLVPAGTRRLRGGSEIGWTVQGEGPLTKIVDLLFLLEKSPPLHRLDNLSLTPSEKSGRVRVRFRYLTLVLEPTPDTPFLGQTNLLASNSEDRPKYQVILTRNFLQPYVAPPPNPAPPAVATASAVIGPDNFRIVSLTEWDGKPEIHVRDAAQNRLQRLKPGDTMAGGAVVRIDYRPMPLPGRGGLLSYSRVILKIGNEYWAIERGQTYADKYRLKPDQLPPNLVPATPVETSHAHPP